MSTNKRKPMKFHNGNIITSKIKIESNHRQYHITIAAPTAKRALELLNERVPHLRLSKGYFTGYFSRNMDVPPTPLREQEGASPDRLVSLFADEEIWVQDRNGYRRLEEVLEK